MKFGQMFSAVREFCGDVPESVITTPQIAFLVMNRMDYYGSQLINAGKGTVEYKVVKNPISREEVFFDNFAFGQPNLVRRLVSHGELEDRWEMLNIVTNIAEFTARENRNEKAIFFTGNKYLLTFDPKPFETLEFWGERPLISNLALTSEVQDIPGLFHHLVVESASIPALNKLLMANKEYASFVTAQKNDLKESIERRENIWRIFLTSEADTKSNPERDIYSPFRDNFYSDYF